MKKFLAIIMAGAMVLSMAGCSGGNSSANSADSDSQQTSAADSSADSSVADSSAAESAATAENSENSDSADSAADAETAYSPENPVTVKIGLTGNVYEDIWNPIKEKLAPEGINLEYEQFTSFNIPNNALNSGEIDIKKYNRMIMMIERLAA